ncbi:hypothetical protein ACLOJK_036580 [Asimina triloba]
MGAVERRDRAELSPASSGWAVAEDEPWMLLARRAGKGLDGLPAGPTDRDADGWSAYWMDGENGGCWASLLMGGRGVAGLRLLGR